MTLSTLPLPSRRPRFSRTWLVCVDLQREHVIPGQPCYAAANAEVAEACRRVLAVGRSAGWRIVHSQQARGAPPSARPQTMFGAPIDGLRPLISEPVFFRSRLSAFADPAFAAEMRDARGDDVYLVGFSMADTCLATALAGFDAGLSLTLLEDAIGEGDAAAADAARAVLAPFARFSNSRELQSRGLEAVT